MSFTAEKIEHEAAPVPGSPKASILFHRHTPWQSAIRCSTNIYAKLFLDSGFDVAYMQGLVHAGHLARRRGQWQSWRQGPRREKAAWVFTPFSLIPYAGFWPFNTSSAAHLAYRSCMPGVGQLLKRGGISPPDVIWSANPGSIALRSVFPRARFVFQAVDFYPAFSGGSVRRIEREDYRAADHIFAIGETLKRYIVGEHGIDESKVTVLGQGVFCKDYRREWPVPAELRGLPRPIGIWVGVLEKGAPDLFTTAAQVLRERGGSLVLIGPDASWTTKLAQSYDNVHVLGPRRPEAVPAYLVHADVGLMLYDQSQREKYQGQNPLKLYEFAAAGLPIVCTPHEEFQFTQPPIITVGGREEVSAAIGTAIERRAELGASSRRFAECHDWHAVFDRARRTIMSWL